LVNHKHPTNSKQTHKHLREKKILTQQPKQVDSGTITVLIIVLERIDMNEPSLAL